MFTASPNQVFKFNDILPVTYGNDNDWLSLSLSLAHFAIRLYYEMEPECAYQDARYPKNHKE